MYSKALQILVVFIIFPLYLSSQCGPATPTFSINLTGNPSGTWLSPNVSRNDVCCGQSGVNCLKFIVTLDPGAAGIIFGIASGPGAASSFYQVNCGPQIAVGSAVCLSGVGPHKITFCKPGNNANTFSITSIPTDVAGIDISVNNGCVKNINATGLTPASVTWNSIYPGVSGAYNNYLSCTSGCLTPTITPIGSPPPYVDYVVCGQPSAMCNFSAICDTVRITFNPTLSLSIVPANPTICFGQTSTSITAVGSGGSPPYNYLDLLP